MNTQSTQAYNYAFFTQDDIDSYKGYLDELPYDRELEEAFLSFKRQERNQKRRDERHLDVRELTDKLVEDEYMHSRAVTVSAHVERLIRDERLYSALMELSPTSRRRIYLCYIRGLTHKKISHIEGVSRPAVSISIYKGIKKLERILKSGLPNGSCVWY